MEQVLICTPTWNKAHFLRTMLHDVAASAGDISYRHVVVDNGSADDTRRVCADFGVERLHNLDNVGIAQALNQCVAMLELGQRFMKLDDDVTFLGTGWLDEMTRVLDGNESIGGVAIPRHGREADQATGNIDVSGVWVIDSDQNWWTNCVLYRWEAMQALGSFWQPGLYGYEDVLTGARLRMLGWRTVYLASYRVVHHGEYETKREPVEYRQWKLKQRTKTNINGLIGEFRSGIRSAHIPLEAVCVAKV